MMMSLGDLLFACFVFGLLERASAFGIRASSRGNHSQAMANASSELTIVTRGEWGARPAKEHENMTNPVAWVVVHHSYIPGACGTGVECEKAMREMQNFHMDDREWWDLGYSFAVGGDGRAYEGRGWSKRGAHAPGYNEKSIGICTIGDFQTELPPAQQLAAIKNLIAYGVKSGHIADDYKLIGHRQARSTECPGQALFDEISSWPHFEAHPNRGKQKADEGVVGANAIPSTGD